MYCKCHKADKWLEQRDIRQAFGGFPLGDGFTACTEQSAKHSLCDSLFYRSVLIVIPVTWEFMHIASFLCVL